MVFGFLYLCTHETSTLPHSLLSQLTCLALKNWSNTVCIHRWKFAYSFASLRPFTIFPQPMEFRFQGIHQKEAVDYGSCENERGSLGVLHIIRKMDSSFYSFTQFFY